jgi:hypothetical protein
MIHSTTGLCQERKMKEFAEKSQMAEIIPNAGGWRARDTRSVQILVRVIIER